MVPRFEGKVALITGGGTGIGAATARRLASEGAHVVVTGRRLELIEGIAREIDGIAVAGSTADEEHMKSAVAAAVARFGGLDVVIANAGLPVYGSAENILLQDFRAAYTTNVEGAMLAARFALPEMRRRGGGAIVLVSSIAAFVGAPQYVGYVTSKAAMLGLNRSIAFDFGPENIRCNVICPGWAHSEMTDDALKGIADSKNITVEQLIAEVVKANPLRRMAQPEEIASAIAFLASSDASFVSGAVLLADGGGRIVDASSTGFDVVVSPNGK